VHGADEELSGNVNQELLRIDDDNGEYDNISVDHMGHLFWGGETEPSLPEKYFDSAQTTAYLT